VLFQERLVAEEDLHALLDRRGRPSGERFLRRGHGAIDLRGARERDTRDHGAAGGIGDVERPRGAAFDELPADVVADRWIFGCGGGFERSHGGSPCEGGECSAVSECGGASHRFQSGGFAAALRSPLSFAFTWHSVICFARRSSTTCSPRRTKKGTSSRK